MTNKDDRTILLERVVAQVEENAKSGRELDSALRMLVSQFEVKLTEVKGLVNQGVAGLHQDLQYSRRDAERAEKKTDEQIALLRGELKEAGVRADGQITAMRTELRDATARTEAWREDVGLRIGALETQVENLVAAEKAHASEIESTQAVARETQLASARIEGAHKGWWETQSLLTKIIIGVISFVVAAGVGALGRHIWNGNNSTVSQKPSPQR